MKITFLLGVVILGLSACEYGAPPKKEKHPIYTDTLTYTYKTIHERAADCGNKPDSACTVVKINYPQFNGNTLLNDTVQAKLLKVFMLSEKPDTSIKSMTANFLKSYADYKKSSQRERMFYDLDTYAKVIQQDSALISLEYGGYVYQGGAHGGSFTGFVNWNTKANKEVMLQDIMIDGYKDKLTNIAEGIFRKDEKLGPTESLEPNYFFKDSKFALNQNYAITPLGLRFMYNQYEIKPYAAGTTELFIPYTAIKNLLKPHTVIAQFINKNAGI
ncbi:DUF3298 and DUF4163 domain-containing protein [Mucilaginibacter glaciei]|uniref:DUF3298 domain-containing protein n=1 Tax=Mucilaginibacter glaciei TaxID=2772109 RepID=A0A926S1H1_9SPHI|nr:DUF3298 and DUF4163 domain-containing protein [Mucilaginibacter glaciei]MBD1392139.1 DUF3298 domain-containing protein [Mucilaginibacter glaciei]